MQINIPEIISRGESSYLEFKGKDVRPESLAREIVSFSNSLGGVILLGVEDNGTIQGIEKKINEEWISNICSTNVIPSVSPEVEIIPWEGKLLAYIEVQKGKHKPYQTNEGKYWIRIGSTNRIASKEELSRLFQEAGLIHFDSSNIINSNMRDLDSEKLQFYWSTNYKINYEELDENEKQNILVNSGILLEIENKIECSLAGLVIFGKRPTQKILQASIVFSAFGGNSITDPLIDKKEIEGTLPDQVEQAVSLLNLLLPIPSSIQGLKRIESPIITKFSLRELIVNAVVHRDYTMRTRKIFIQLFQNRIVISSPGKIPNTLTIEKIKVGSSSPRNILLLKFMDNLGYIDGLGRGIPSVIRELKDRVQFAEDIDEFKVTIWKS